MFVAVCCSVLQCDLILCTAQMRHIIQKWSICVSVPCSVLQCDLILCTAQLRCDTQLKSDLYVLQCVGVGLDSLHSSNATHNSKVTYLYEKRNIYMKSDLCLWNMTYLYEKRLVYLKRDLQKRPAKETYKRDLQKRPTKETCKRDLYILILCVSV